MSAGSKRIKLSNYLDMGSIKVWLSPIIIHVEALRKSRQMQIHFAKQCSTPELRRMGKNQIVDMHSFAPSNVRRRGGILFLCCLFGVLIS